MAEQQQEEEERKLLYVGNLDPTVNSLDLCIIFSKICNVANVHVGYDLWGHSFCYAYVTFFSAIEAAKAKYVLNHTNLKGKPMRIVWCKRNPITRKTGRANLIVKNLDTSINSARLGSIFSKFGTVLSCEVIEDDNGNSKGVGYVQFDREECAMKAINSLHDTLLKGKKLYVSYFLKRSQKHLRFSNLYVKNLKKDVSEDDLKEEFSKYGKVNSGAIMRDDLGISKSYGFVSFESPEVAKKAMEALIGTRDLGYDSLLVRRAQKKAERERMMILKQKIFTVMDNGNESFNSNDVGNGNNNVSNDSVNNYAQMADLGAGGGQEQAQNLPVPPPVIIPEPHFQPRPMAHIVSFVSFNCHQQNLNTWAVLAVVFADDLQSWQALAIRIRGVYQIQGDPMDIAPNLPSTWPGRVIRYRCLVDNHFDALKLMIGLGKILPKPWCKSFSTYQLLAHAKSGYGMLGLVRCILAISIYRRLPIGFSWPW